MHGPAAAFNVSKSRPPSQLNCLFLRSFPNIPSLGRLVLLYATDRYLCKLTANNPFAALVAAKNYSLAGLKLESPISHSRFNTLSVYSKLVKIQV
jgi:hypothetical protein